MHYNIKEIIDRLQEQRQQVKFRHRTLTNESSYQTKQEENKRRLSTLEPPSMSLQNLELDIHKNVKSSKRLPLKKISSYQRRNSHMIQLRKQTYPVKEETFLPLIDFSLLERYPLPIVFVKHEKMIKLKKRSSRVIDI